MSNAANFPILSLILFTPLVGAARAPVREQEAGGPHPVDREPLRVRRVRGVGAAVVLVPALRAAVPVRGALPVDPLRRRRLLPGRGRVQRAADPADDADGHHRRAVVVDGDQGAGQGVLHLPARAPGRHDRRLHLPRLPAVLPVLGGHAGADVLPDRHLGQRPAPLLGDQVLPVHPGRQRRDAARHPRPLLPLPRRHGRVQLRHHASTRR